MEDEVVALPLETSHFTPGDRQYDHAGLVDRTRFQINDCILTSGLRNNCSLSHPNNPAAKRRNNLGPGATITNNEENNSNALKPK